ncbi:hypothetical protein DRW07_03680 [Alteromonas sediminis]|uniref:VanZ-like domain-containing protein n=1 Tax=Alteromonas sediminis TaxID=2259342 RepID=A0A3N5Y5R2_9ALTE|nr:VanZ family protein [Alteromonas sediminis]RPJ68516.1 hypothetical protein DRW07_03680 [Alteromonas sediminis]
MSKTNSPPKHLVAGLLILFAICTLPLFFVSVKNLNLPESTQKLQDGSHIFIFLAFGFLLFASIKRTLFEKSAYTFLILFIASYTIEVVQDYVGRTFQVEDIVRNMLGVSLSLCIMLCIKSKTLTGKTISGVGLLAVFALCYLELAPAFRQALQSF